MMAHTCCAGIFDGYRHHACGRKAKYERDGKHYCGTHDPVAVIAKDAVRRSAWSAKYDAEVSASRLAYAAPDLLAALEGVLRVADRQTTEFDAARAAIKKALGDSQ